MQFLALNMHLQGITLWGKTYNAFQRHQKEKNPDPQSNPPFDLNTPDHLGLNRPNPVHLLPDIVLERVKLQEQ